MKISPPLGLGMPADELCADDGHGRNLVCYDARP
jgi:hypothetical protein